MSIDMATGEPTACNGGISLGVRGGGLGVRVRGERVGEGWVREKGVGDFRGKGVGKARGDWG